MPDNSPASPAVVSAAAAATVAVAAEALSQHSVAASARSPSPTPPPALASVRSEQHNIVVTLQDAAAAKPGGAQQRIARSARQPKLAAAAEKYSVSHPLCTAHLWSPQPYWRSEDVMDTAPEVLTDPYIGPYIISVRPSAFWYRHMDHILIVILAGEPDPGRTIFATSCFVPRIDIMMVYPSFCAFTVTLLQRSIISGPRLQPSAPSSDAREFILPTACPPLSLLSFSLTFLACPRTTAATATSAPVARLPACCLPCRFICLTSLLFFALVVITRDPFTAQLRYKLHVKSFSLFLSAFVAVMVGVATGAALTDSADESEAATVLAVISFFGTIGLILTLAVTFIISVLQPPPAVERNVPSEPRNGQDNVSGKGQGKADNAAAVVLPDSLPQAAAAVSSSPTNSVHTS